MSDFHQVRRDAKRLGPLGDSTLPISIQPKREWQISRIIIAPALKSNGSKIAGKYVKHPAIITTLAFTAGEASARADEIKYNKQNDLWGNGSRPWSGGGSWQEVPLPDNTPAMFLR